MSLLTPLSSNGESTPEPQGKRARNAQRIRSSIVEAMAKLIEEKGYAGATIAETLVLAGVSLGTFYKHFDSKQSILLSIMEREHSLRRSSVDDALAADDLTPVDYLLAVIEALLDTTSQDAKWGVWREILAASISLAANPAVADGLNADRQRYTGYTLRALERMILVGRLRPDTPKDDLAQALFCIMAYEFQTFVCGGYADADALAVQMRRMVEVTIRPWQVTP
ncbi:MAG: TetR/AcrR family transcriptional regulator [Paracoccaceae bacterium]